VRKDQEKPIKEARTILLASEEDALRRRDLTELFRIKGIAHDDMEMETILADTRRPTEWTAAASSAPFFGDHRVVLVRNVLRVNPLDEWEEKPKSKDHPFVKELRALPDYSVLVLIADDEAGDEDKQSRLQSVLKRWVDIVASGGQHVMASKTDPKDVMEQVRRIARERGKHMTPGTATLLTEMTGGSLSLALGELEKLVWYVGSAESIQDSDVRAVVKAEQEYNVYQLVDAIVAGDSGGALKQLRTLVTRNDKIEGQAFSRIFPTVARQFRVIWQARLCLDADCRVSDPTPAVLDMLPSKNRINEEREWGQQRAVRAARRLSLRQIKQVFHELVEADAKVKGLGPAYTTNETVEQMVLRMAAVCRTK
jgi:DNA polymerase-3 subunit delta